MHYTLDKEQDKQCSWIYEFYLELQLRKSNGG
jgi:hypothetical protein